MMRSEREVHEMRDALRRIQAGLEASIAAYNEEAAYQFNENSRLLCALDWVLGSDTMRREVGCSAPQESGGVE